MSRNVRIDELEEGNEILLDSRTGQASIIEDVTEVVGGIAITLIDGLKAVRRPNQIVTILS